MVNRISGRLAGLIVVFHAYDGRDYLAYVEAVRNGVATLRYRTSVGMPEYTAYISDRARISPAAREAATWTAIESGDVRAIVAALEKGRAS